jgi:hypothetical protein
VERRHPVGLSSVHVDQLPHQRSNGLDVALHGRIDDGRLGPRRDNP